MKSRGCNKAKCISLTHLSTKIKTRPLFYIGSFVCDDLDVAGVPKSGHSSKVC